MDVYEAMEKRRSVRAYQKRPVEPDKLQRVVNAGRLSPSARNRQERRFVIVQDAQRRKALAEAAEQAWLAEAPVLIAVVGTTPKAVMHCGVPTDPVDCAIAVDHITLAAVAEGLGSCWIGHFDQDACRKLLGVPEDAWIIEMLAMGYPEDPPAPRPRKSYEEVVRHEKYD